MSNTPKNFREFNRIFMALRRITYCSHFTKKNGDKKTQPLPARQIAHSVPSGGDITNSLVPPTFQSASNLFLALAWPKCLSPSAQTGSDGIRSVLRGVIIRNSHGVATLLLAVPVAPGAASQAGVLIELSEAPALMQTLYPTWWCFAQSCAGSFSKIK